MSDKEARKTLMGQAGALGMEVDGRWSIETLAEKVQEAIEGQEAQNNAKVRQSSDTWVFAIRDCFLGTEKKPSGSVFKAPKELYANWKATGAARLADEDEIAHA